MTIGWLNFVLKVFASNNNNNANKLKRAPLVQFRPSSELVWNYVKSFVALGIFGKNRFDARCAMRWINHIMNLSAFFKICALWIHSIGFKMRSVTMVNVVTGVSRWICSEHKYQNANLSRKFLGFVFRFSIWINLFGIFGNKRIFVSQRVYILYDVD